jgi:hypothetical protein
MGNLLSAAAADIIAERRRQMLVEGWTLEHDDQHEGGQMALAAASYAIVSTGEPEVYASVSRVPCAPGFKAGWINGAKLFWPWSDKWWKPKSRREDLVRAGALILAEIERLDRLEARREQTKWAAQSKKRRDAAAKSTERKIREMGK